MRKNINLLCIAALVAVAVVRTASAQVWINTNVASTSGPLPGASPSALYANASILYFPSILRLMTNMYLHDDWTNSLASRIRSGSAWTNYAAFSTDTNEPSAIFDVGDIGGISGRIGIYDGAAMELYRFSASDGTIYGTWGTNAVNGLWSYPSSPYDYAAQPTWLGLVNDDEANRIAALAGGLSASTWSEYPATQAVDMGGQAITNAAFVGADTLATGLDGVDYSRILFFDNVEKYSYALTYYDKDVHFGPTNVSHRAAWQYNSGTNVWSGRVNDTEASRIAALGTPGTGWTNLSITGSGNVITGATATATTLTLQRGTVEGGTGTANETALADPYVLAGTNVVFSYTNNWVQSWVATSAASQISFAIKTNAAQAIGGMLYIKATTMPILWITNVPPVTKVGNVPSNAVSAWRVESLAGTTNLIAERVR